MTGAGSLPPSPTTAWVVARQAMVTYAQGVRTYFLGQLSRSQIAAMGENCRRISAALKVSDRASKADRA